MHATCVAPDKHPISGDKIAVGGVIMAAPNAMPIRDDLQEGISYLVSRKVTNNEYAGLRDAARQKYIGPGMHSW